MLFRRGSFSIAGILVAAGLLLPAGAAAAALGSAYGDITGSPFNRSSGQSTGCSYGNGGNTTSTSGLCGYTSVGLINRVISGHDWSTQADSFVGQVTSSIGADGSVHAVSTAQFNNEPVDPNFIGDSLQGSSAAFANAYAVSYDIMTFGNLVPIKVVYNFSFDGFFFNNDHAEATGYAQFDYHLYFNGTSVSDSDFLMADASHTYQLTALVNPGGTAEFSLGLQVHSTLGCSSNFGGAHLCQANESTNFLNTGKVTGITVEDLSGNVLSGYTATSQSGFDFNPILTNSAEALGAPEPGGILLALTGLAFGALLRGVRYHVNRSAI
jgi:hypothetical protein